MVRLFYYVDMDVSKGGSNTHFDVSRRVDYAVKTRLGKHCSQNVVMHNSGAGHSSNEQIFVGEEDQGKPNVIVDRKVHRGKTHLHTCRARDMRVASQEILNWDDEMLHGASA